MSSMKWVNNIQAEKLIRETDNLIILDVRRYREYKEGRIENAVNIPVDDLEYSLDELEKYKDKPILVYCKIGARSNIACLMLEEAGFEKIYNLRGGFLDFKGTIEKSS